MGTTGGKIGRAAAAAIGLSLLGFLLFVRFYGACAEPVCRHGEGVAALTIVGATAAIAGSLGLAIRYAVNAVAARRRGDRG